MLRTTIRSSIPAMRAASRATPASYRFKSSAADDLYGDYPKVPEEFMQHKDPYKKYDDQQARRNFNEPLPPRSDLYDVWSPDRFEFASDSSAIGRNVLFFTGIAAFGYFIYYFAAPEKVAVPRQYPYDGLYKALGGDEETKEIYGAKGKLE